VLLFVGLIVSATGFSKNISIESMSPIVSMPTSNSVTITVLALDNKEQFLLTYRKAGDSIWIKSPAKQNSNDNKVVAWKLVNLETASRYEYQISRYSDKRKSKLSEFIEASFVLPKPPGEGFKALLFSDSHIGPSYDMQQRSGLLHKIVNLMVKDQPDFIIGLGDNICWPGSTRSARQVGFADFAYKFYRVLLSPLARNSAYFGVIGNWEGENGIVPFEDRQKIIKIRQQYMPTPDDKTGEYDRRSPLESGYSRTCP